MSKGGVESMISKLYEQKEMGGAVIFGVLNGKLSEGVDYSDNVPGFISLYRPSTSP